MSQKSFNFLGLFASCFSSGNLELCTRAFLSVQGNGISLLNPPRLTPTQDLPIWIFTSPNHDVQQMLHAGTIQELEILFLQYW